MMWVEAHLQIRPFTPLRGRHRFHLYIEKDASLLFSTSAYLCSCMYVFYFFIHMCGCVCWSHRKARRNILFTSGSSSSLNPAALGLASRQGVFLNRSRRYMCTVTQHATFLFSLSLSLFFSSYIILFFFSCVWMYECMYMYTCGLGQCKKEGTSFASHLYTTSSLYLGYLYIHTRPRVLFLSFFFFFWHSSESTCYTHFIWACLKILGKIQWCFSFFFILHKQEWLVF